ncbi:MAG: hypothetical protein Q9195_008752 [Heterodermia aff. obscurata]
MMIEIISQQKQLIKAFYVPPSILDQWARDPEGVCQVQQLSFVLYDGGPLAPDVGHSLCNVTDVCQMYGSGEAGQIQLLVPQKGEWAYMEWNPYEEVDMQPLNEGLSMIVFSDQRRPFSRAPKGTLVRRLTIQEYAKEIDKLYDEESIDHEGPVIETLSFADINLFLQECVLLILPDAQLSDHTDLFELEFNSEKVAELVTKIRRGTSRYVKSSTSPITMSLIYSHTVISELALSILTILENSSGTCPKIGNLPLVEDLVDKYTLDLPPPRSYRKKGFSVMLTGSTGSEVTQEMVRQKLKYIQADFSREYLGLDDRTYANLLANVNLLIHLAWDANFNRSLPSCESPHLIGLRSLVDFSASSERHARIVFASSTSYALAWALAYNKTTIPEDIILSSGEVSDTGYGESKQAAERILAVASDRSKVPIEIIRVGQIAGPRLKTSDTMWLKHE